LKLRRAAETTGFAEADKYKPRNLVETYLRINEDEEVSFMATPGDSTEDEEISFMVLWEPLKVSISTISVAENIYQNFRKNIL